MSDGKSDLMSVSQAGQEGCIMRIIVDAMGGDNAPGEIVKGCLDALRMAEGFEIELIGDSARISQLIEGQGYRRDRLVITHKHRIY